MPPKGKKKQSARKPPPAAPKAPPVAPALNSKKEWYAQTIREALGGDEGSELGSELDQVSVTSQGTGSTASIGYPNLPPPQLDGEDTSDSESDMELTEKEKLQQEMRTAVCLLICGDPTGESDHSAKWAYMMKGVIEVWRQVYQDPTEFEWHMDRLQGRAKVWQEALDENWRMSTEKTPAPPAKPAVHAISTQTERPPTAEAAAQTPPPKKYTYAEAAAQTPEAAAQAPPTHGGHRRQAAPPPGRKEGHKQQAAPTPRQKEGGQRDHKQQTPPKKTGVQMPPAQRERQTPPEKAGFRQPPTYPTTTRALVMHAAPLKYKPGTMRRWIEEDNKGVKILGIRWLLREDRRGKVASSLVIYMSDLMEVTKLRMGRRLFRTTSYDWDR